MKLSDLLNASVITVNLKARDKKGALEEMAGLLRKTGRIEESATMLAALLEREATGSTAMGRGIAFPHARVDGLKEPIALLALSPIGIDFKAPDGHPVHLCFLFLTPAEETELHLQILSEAAALFSDKDLCHALRHASTPQAALAIQGYLDILPSFSPR